MEKRFQVFVSSTYEDLQEERQEVMHALLELDCIPSGMELFPAASEDQWSLIKKVIDDCDYYIVIIGGRYGSIGPDGKSYTEMEYRYAMETDKPIIAFIHKEPDSLPAKRTEQSPEGKKKLEEFRALVQLKMCKNWTTPAELGSVVSRSLIRLIKTNPAIGWVRADALPSQETTTELLNLRKRVEELQKELDNLSTKAPQGAEDLAQSEDEYEIHYTFSARNYNMSPMTLDAHAAFKTSWNDIFSAISPSMINEASEGQIKIALNVFVESMQREYLEKNKELAGRAFSLFKINDSDYDTIIVQLRAIGLIQRSEKPRSVKDTRTYWSLTPYGDHLMTQLRAIKKT